MGKPPGTITYAGSQEQRLIKIERVTYGKDNQLITNETIPQEELENALDEIDENITTWINVLGIQDVGIVKRIGEKLKFHNITMEDITDPHQRTKIDVFQDHIFIIIRRTFDLPDQLEYDSLQVGIVIGKNYVITFSELDDAFFDPIKSMINKYNSVFKSYTSDFLGYSILDYIVDTYIIKSHEIEDKIDEIENRIEAGDFNDIINDIHELRRENLAFRKLVLPLQDIPTTLRRIDIPILSKDVNVIAKDLNDHLNQLIDNVELNREMLTTLRENYSSELSNKMNQIMMTLTVLSSILLPLTFITSLYGMNFTNMPELNWKYGYFASWVVMLAISGILLFVFRRAKWL